MCSTGLRGRCAPVIYVEDLHKFFGDNHVLRGVNQHITKGEKLVVIGPSGSGKSTFLRCLNLLEMPSSGKVIFEGTDIMQRGVDINHIRQRMGMVFQQFNLFPHKTVLENITLAPVHLKVMTKEQANQRAMELLERVGLPEKANAYPASLSGGQKQRIAIAGVIAMRPKCIVLDEPTAMLDPQGRRDVLQTIRRLNREAGITIILITHHMDEAAQADRVIAMETGRILCDGTPKEVFTQVEKLQQAGLTVPQTTQLLYRLRSMGYDLPLDALSVTECAQALHTWLEA